MRVKFMPENVEILSASDLVIDEPSTQKGHWSELLHREAVALEIGCGAGAFIRAMSQQEAELGWIGLERIGTVLAKAVLRYDRENETLSENLRLIRGDANLLTDYFEDGEIDRIYLNFSDPWPKKAHAKRRLSSDRFLPVYRRLLKAGGYLQMKTDNDDLFAFSMESLKENGWEILEWSNDLHHSDYLPDNVMTEYETKFSQAGKTINYLKAVPIPGFVKEAKPEKENE